MIFSILFLSTIVAANSASAQYNYGNNRGQERELRITEGVRRGFITQQEAHRLRLQVRRINLMKKDALSDGYFSPQEKMRISRAEQQADMVFYREYRDRDTRW